MRQHLLARNRAETAPNQGSHVGRKEAGRHYKEFIYIYIYIIIDNYSRSMLHGRVGTHALSLGTATTILREINGNTMKYHHDLPDLRYLAINNPKGNGSGSGVS